MYQSTQKRNLVFMLEPILAFSGFISSSAMKIIIKKYKLRPNTSKQGLANYPRNDHLIYQTRFFTFCHLTWNEASHPYLQSKSACKNLCSYSLINYCYIGVNSNLIIVYGVCLYAQNEDLY